LEFAIGDNSVIDGWSDGLLQLNEGSSATLFVPPHLGYGAKGIVDFIPPNATLIFYVELLSVE
jgi:FKBP-type peptidyl-prolyl cis-trans isomerase